MNMTVKGKLNGEEVTVEIDWSEYHRIYEAYQRSCWEEDAQNAIDEVVDRDMEEPEVIEELKKRRDDVVDKIDSINQTDESWHEIAKQAVYCVLDDIRFEISAKKGE